MLAEDGFDALAKSMTTAPSGFCDILMPSAGRIPDLCHHQAQREVCRYAGGDAVVKDGVFDKASWSDGGLQDYLTKPFTKRSILQAVLQHSLSSAQGMMPIKKS